MGEIIILDKSKADIILSMGFRYTERNIDKKKVYVFIDTPEVRKLISCKFNKNEFYINKTVCF